jgi:hypothetical protein
MGGCLQTITKTLGYFTVEVKARLHYDKKLAKMVGFKEQKILFLFHPTPNLTQFLA